MNYPITDSGDLAYKSMAWCRSRVATSKTSITIRYSTFTNTAAKVKI